MKTDIDIDFADRDQALMGMAHIAASQENKGVIQKHNSGVYFQNIPQHPQTGISALTYAPAEDLGYFKVDFLNQSVYREVTSEQHLDELLNREPVWELLEERTFVSELTHIHNHYAVVQRIKPKSIEDLAVVLALIRPGKKHLVYQDRSVIDREIWSLTRDQYEFKKAHAISYAALIVVQMNLIVDRLTRQIEGNVDEFITF